MSWTVHHVLFEMAHSVTFAADFEVPKTVDQSLNLGPPRRLGLSVQIPELATNATLLFPWDAS